MADKFQNVSKVAKKLGVKVGDVYAAVRPLAKAGLLKLHLGIGDGGRPCRLLDSAGVALVAKALKVPGPKS